MKKSELYKIIKDIVKEQKSNNLSKLADPFGVETQALVDKETTFPQAA